MITLHINPIMRRVVVKTSFGSGIIELDTDTQLIAAYMERDGLELVSKIQALLAEAAGKCMFIPRGK